MEKDREWRQSMERADVLIEVLMELAQANLEAPILVEGNRDEASLRNLGIRGEIIRINTGMTLTHTAEDLASGHDRIILLMDWDRKGQELQEKMARLLRTDGVEADTDLSKRLFLACGKKIRQVEETASYFRHNANAENLLRLEQGMELIYRQC